MNIYHSFLVLAFMLLTCNKKTNTFYEGIVLDENNDPIKNVTVFEESGSENMTNTDDSHNNIESF